MWNDYFDGKCYIYGIDIDPSVQSVPDKLGVSNIQVDIGDQENRDFWKKYLKDKPKFDIVIEDGGHTMQQQIVTFEELYNHVSDNGVYLCEDTHTSYWSSYGGGLKKSDSFIEYSKNWIDMINAYHNGMDLQFRKITNSIHYYDSIVVLEKKIDNKEPISTYETYTNVNLQEIHNHTRGVDMRGELPEQQIIFDYLPRNSKVLELGGNIGRSSIIISNLLNNPLQHVVVESDPKIAKHLKTNRDRNNLKFHIEVGAISNKKIIQKEWNTKVLDTNTIPNGWKEVPTITLSNLYNKYNINFDTIVADCEGCLFDILKNNLWILPQIKTIIIENDFDKKEFEKFLESYGFSSKHCKDGVDIPKKFDNKCFYQVWSK